MATTLQLEPHYPDFFKPGSQLDTFAETFPPDPDPEVCPLFIDYNRVDISPKTYFDVGIWGFGDFQLPPALKNQIPRNRQYIIPSAAGLVAYAQSKQKGVYDLSKQEIYDYVDATFDVHVALVLDQFSESGVREDTVQYRWYYERVRQNIDAAFQAGMIARKPFVGGGYTGPSSFSAQCSRFTAQDSHIRNPLGRRFTDPTRPLPEYYDADNALGFCHYVRDGRQNIMGTNAGTYQASPGWVDDFYEWFNAMFVGLLARTKYTAEQQAVASLGFFNWEVTGDSRDAFAVDWEVATTNPEGRALTAQRIPIAPTMIEAMGFLTGFFLDWAVMWDEGNKRITDPNAIDSYKPGLDASEQSVIWFSKAQPTVERTGPGAFPFQNSPYIYNRPKGPKGNRDFFYLGYRKGKAMRKLYTKSQVSFVDYSLDGGAYVTAQAGGKEILQAASGYRRVVLRFDDGTNVRFVDFNPYGDSLGHTITVKRANGQEYTFPIIDGLLNITGPPTTTTPGTPAVFSITGSYNRTTHKLSLSGANASGPISYQIPNTTDGFELQPDGGFLLPAILRGSTISIQGRTGSGQTAQTQLAIPADAVSPTPGTAPVLPQIGIGLYNQTVEARDYGNGLENRTAYEQYGLIYVPNSDGIRVPSVGPAKYLPPFLKQLRETAVAANATDKLGGYSTVLWSNFKVGQSLTSAWAPGGLSAAWKRLMTNQFTYAHDNNMSLGLALAPGREGGFREFISDADRSRDHSQSLSTFDVVSPAPRLFGRLKAAGFDVSNIDTTTTAGKYLADLKLFMNFMKPFYANGSLSFVMPGIHDNFEFGYAAFQTSPSGSWTDWHPDEIYDLQQYLKGLYSGNLAALGQAWFNNPNAYANWEQVTLPYTGDFGDFKGQRGKDCEKFRHIRLGDCAELFARVIWSELYAIPFVIQTGQPFGGQGGIIGTVDVGYFYKRVQAVADELGITTPCVVGKCNPIAYENYRVRARYMAYLLQQSVGYVLTMQESSYEFGSTDIDAVNVSNIMSDYLRYAHTGRAADAVTSFAVLFSPQKWAGVDSEGNPSDPGNSVLAMFARLFSLGNRHTPPFGFNTASPEKTLTITLDQMLAGMGPGAYPWFAQTTLDWTGLNGENEDVKFLVNGLGLPTAATAPTNGCVPVTGGTLGSDLTVQQNSEYVLSIDGLAGSTPSMVFTWVATNGAVLLQGGGAHDFAARYRFPNVGECIVSCQVTNCGGTIARSVKATVPAAPADGSLQPSFDFSLVHPYVQNGVLQPAKLTLFNLKNATRYKLFEGPVTDNNAATAADIPPGGGILLPAPPPGVSKAYSVRAWNGTDNSKWADRSFTVTSPPVETTQYIRRIQTKRTPGQVNQNGIQLRVETIGGYVPRFAFSKSGGFPTLLTTSAQVPAFVQGTYQYGTIISDAPNTGAEYITVGFANSQQQVVNIAINDKSGTDTDWVTQYDSTLNA